MYDIDLFYIASGESKSGKIWGKTILIFAVFTFQNCRQFAAAQPVRAWPLRYWVVDDSEGEVRASDDHVTASEGRRRHWASAILHHNRS